MPFQIAPEKEFFGRKEELVSLYNRACEAEKGNARSIILAGQRGIGKTELAKQLFNYLFWKQDAIAPFYYCVNNAILSVSDFSRDYLISFLCQRSAFEKKKSGLIYNNTLSMETLTSLLEKEKALWALELLDQYAQCKEPVDFLRTALNSPQSSVLSTGVAVVVIIDEFQRLQNLHAGAQSEPAGLTPLFEQPLSFRKTFTIITGSRAEIQEMPVVSSLQQIEVRPLKTEDAQELFTVICEQPGEQKKELCPNALFTHINGNPLYITSVAKTARHNKQINEKDPWKAYVDEISSGSISRYWSAIFKSRFPELGRRRLALEIINKIYHSADALTSERINKAFFMNGKETEAFIKEIYFSGFVNAEYGLLKAPDDRVLIDCVESLYQKEINSRPARDVEKGLLEKTPGSRQKGVLFEITIPMLKEAELVAAQCLEQVGKNLHMDQDIIGQLQLAVIEACINAMEHSKAEEDRNIYLTFHFADYRIEIGIESSGREFISQGTDEPFIGSSLRQDTGRGWGIKLMKNFADSVRFEKTDRGTKIVLVKNISHALKINKEVNSSGE